VKIRVAAQATTIVLFALVMGVFWGTWFSLSRTMDQLSSETFLAVGHEMIRNLGVPMAVLLPLALLSALVTLVLLWPDRTAAFWWLAAGFVLMLAALVITLAVEVPIDNQIETWTAATLPGDWRSIQSRWELWHAVRTFASIAAVVAATISAVVAPRPSRQPTTQLVPPGRAGAGDPADVIAVLATQSVDLAGVGVADRQGGLDECGVGESLGVVAEVAVVPGVDLLGQEAERVDELQQLGEQLGRFVDPPDAGEGLDQPERAG
jgi:uncharacterized membrane protein